MPKKKKAPQKKPQTSKKNKVPIKTTKITPRKEKPYEFALITPNDIWSSFDDVFSRFRSDFEDLLFPSHWDNIFPIIPETRSPLVDLEDQGKNYLLKAEMPGFKKGDIEIDVKDDSVTVSAEVGWSYDKKEQEYICKERECKSFYRSVQLPEEIDIDKVAAELDDGVLEVNLPKKRPKQRRKVKIK
jgi:HSP20 family protein